MFEWKHILCCLELYQVTEDLQRQQGKAKQQQATFDNHFRGQFHSSHWH